MHVEWKLALSLKALLFWRDLVVSLNHNTLGKQLLLSSTSADFLEGCLCLVDKTSSESAETDLDESSVEQDLAVHVESVDCLLQMGHQHHIACLVVVVVQCEEVNLAKHSSSSDNAFAVDKEVIAQDVDKGCGIGNLASWGDGGIQRCRDCLPAIFLENLDDCRWLREVSCEI